MSQPDQTQRLCHAQGSELTRSTRLGSRDECSAACEAEHKMKISISSSRAAKRKQKQSRWRNGRRAQGALEGQDSFGRRLPSRGSGRHEDEILATHSQELLLQTSKTEHTAGEAKNAQGRFNEPAEAGQARSGPRTTSGSLTPVSAAVSFSQLRCCRFRSYMP